MTMKVQLSQIAMSGIVNRYSSLFGKCKTKVKQIGKVKVYSENGSFPYKVKRSTFLWYVKLAAMACSFAILPLELATLIAAAILPLAWLIGRLLKRTNKYNIIATVQTSKTRSELENDILNNEKFKIWLFNCTSLTGEQEKNLTTKEETFPFKRHRSVINKKSYIEDTFGGFKFVWMIKGKENCFLSVFCQVNENEALVR